MTQEERMGICSSCEHSRLDMRKGVVCRESGEPGEFETECPDYTLSAEVGGKAPDSNKPKKIEGFFGFYLFWFIPLGMLISLITTITSFDMNDYVVGKFLMAYDIFFIVVYVVICIYVIYAFVKCRTDAIFAAKSQLLMLLFSNLLLTIAGAVEAANTVTVADPVQSSNISSILWSVVLFIYICVSEDVNNRIPKETRKLSGFSKYFVLPSIVVLFLCLAAGLTESVNGYRLFADPEEKLEDVCKQSAAMLPEGDLYSITMEDHAVVYGMNATWGELTALTAERLGITVKEGMIFNWEIDSDFEEFVNLCIEAGYDLKYNLTDINAGTCVTVVISHEELSNMMQPGYTHTVPADSWEAALELYNKELPKLFSEGNYIQNVAVDLEQQRIIYDLYMENISVYILNYVTTDILAKALKANFEPLLDDLMTLADLSGFDLVCNFTAEASAEWRKQVVFEHDDIF